MAEKILVLDDSPVALTAVEGILQDRFQVVTTTDWVEANKIAHRQKPALIMIDQNLGVFQGTYLVRAYRTFFGSDFPLIVFSGDDVEAECLEAGATAFIHKSRLQSDLLDLIDRLLDHPGEAAPAASRPPGPCLLADALARPDLLDPVGTGPLVLIPPGAGSRHPVYMTPSDDETSPLVPSVSETASIDLKNLEERSFSTESSLVVPLVKRGGDAEGLGVITVGRGPSNDLRLTDPDISRFHAQFLLGADTGRVWQLVDRGSSNGTFVNDHLLTPHVTFYVAAMDQVRFGGLLVVVLDRKSLAQFASS